MGIERIETVTYKTSDGKIFDTAQQAEKWEMRNKNVIGFQISHGPDLTEGRGFMRKSNIKVRANANHLMFAEYAAYKIFGNKVAFVQGVFGSNAICPNWSLTKGTHEDPYWDIFVEEKFINPIMAEHGVWLNRHGGLGFVKQ